jgi:hypothetical protein
MMAGARDINFHDDEHAIPLLPFFPLYTVILNDLLFFFFFPFFSNAALVGANSCAEYPHGKLAT